jgi:hypothetical protein
VNFVLIRFVSVLVFLCSYVGVVGAQFSKLDPAEEAAVKAKVETLLYHWVEQHDLPSALREMTAPSHAATVSLADMLTESKNLNVELWRRKFMTCFLLVDHGTCSQDFGHGLPRKKEYASAPASLADVVHVLGPNALYKGKAASLKKGDPVYIPAWNGVEDAVLVSFLLPHLPREALTVVMLKEGGVWRPAFMFPSMVV